MPRPLFILCLSVIPLIAAHSIYLLPNCLFGYRNCLPVAVIALLLSAVFSIGLGYLIFRLFHR